MTTVSRSVSHWVITCATRASNTCWRNTNRDKWNKRTTSWSLKFITRRWTTYKRRSQGSHLDPTSRRFYQLAGMLKRNFIDKRKSVGKTVCRVWSFPSTSMISKHLIKLWKLDKTLLICTHACWNISLIMSWILELFFKRCITLSPWEIWSKRSHTWRETCAS